MAGIHAWVPRVWRTTARYKITGRGFALFLRVRARSGPLRIVTDPSVSWCINRALARQQNVIQEA
jgi:hypothetical protein